MLAKLKVFVKNHFSDIVLVLFVVLISMLSFAAGYLVAKYQEKETIRFDKQFEDL